MSNYVPRDRCDLHLHSLYSDGTQTTRELCAAAARKRLWAIALTDHDSTAGVCEAVAEAEAIGLRCVPGCEVSSGGSGNTHILCYGSGIWHPDVQQWLHSVQSGRMQRAMQIVDKLRAAGICLSDKAVESLRIPQVGRMHIARLMVAEGFAENTGICFDKYLRNGACCYVPRNLPTSLDTVRALSPYCRTVLAHPMRLGFKMTEVYGFLLYLRDAGLWGVEAYHPSAAHGQSDLLARFAQNNGLQVTGGSDCHGDTAGRHADINEFRGHGEGMRETVLSLLKA